MNCDLVLPDQVRGSETSPSLSPPPLAVVLHLLPLCRCATPVASLRTLSARPMV